MRKERLDDAGADDHHGGFMQLLSLREESPVLDEVAVRVGVVVG